MKSRIAALVLVLSGFAANAQDCAPYALPKAGVDATYSATQNGLPGTLRVKILSTTSTESVAQFTISAFGVVVDDYQRKGVYQSSNGFLVLSRVEETRGTTTTRLTFSPPQVFTPLQACTGATYAIPSVTQTTETIQ